MKFSSRKAKRSSTSRRFPTAIDLFSGAGGLTCGLLRAGFDVRAAVELDLRAQATYSLNHPAVHLLPKDIRTVTGRELLKVSGVRKGQLDLLAGCPPCQGFSRLRTRNKRGSVADKRNDLVGEFLRLIIELMPRTIMLENVPSLRDDRRLRVFLREIESLGFRSTVQVLDAAEFGVAQRRKRLILLASRVHEPAIGNRSRVRPTVRSVIAGLERPSVSTDKLHALPEVRSPSVRALISDIPKNGGSRSDLGKRRQLACHRKSDGFNDVYGRMSWDRVAPTITGGCHNPSRGRFLHPSQNRAISLREAAMLQGFPRRYRFLTEHGKESIALMIGNALPPPFIAAHARSLRRGLERKRGRPV